MKRTSSNSLRSASWTWHISAPILCMAFLSLLSPISPSTSSVWIPTAVPFPSWLVPQHPHHLHQTPSLSPFRANVVEMQIQVCQGRVVLQSLCQSLTADKHLQNTWWNHEKWSKIHIVIIQEFSVFLPHSSHASAHTHMWSPMKWKEQAQIHLDLHDGLGTSQHQSSV